MWGLSILVDFALLFGLIQLAWFAGVECWVLLYDCAWVGCTCYCGCVGFLWWLCLDCFVFKCFLCYFGNTCGFHLLFGYFRLIYLSIACLLVLVTCFGCCALLFILVLLYFFNVFVCCLLCDDGGFDAVMLSVIAWVWFCCFYLV